MNSLQLGLLFFTALKHSRFCTFRPQLFNCSLCQTPITDRSPDLEHGTSVVASQTGSELGKDPVVELQCMGSAYSLAAAEQHRLFSTQTWCFGYPLVCSHWRGRGIVRLCRPVTWPMFQWFTWNHRWCWALALMRVQALCLNITSDLLELILCFSSSALSSVVWNSALCARNVKRFFLCINNLMIVLKLAKFYKNPLTGQISFATPFPGPVRTDEFAPSKQLLGAPLNVTCSRVKLWGLYCQATESISLVLADVCASDGEFYPGSWGRACGWSQPWWVRAALQLLCPQDCSAPTWQLGALTSERLFVSQFLL